MKIIKKADIVFISLVSIAIILSSIALYLGFYKPTNTVVVEVKGEVFGRYSLDNYCEIDINGTNTLKIDQTGAYMIYADCPDKLCLKQAKINSNLGVIVCLPNEVVVYLEGETNEEIDVMS